MTTRFNVQVKQHEETGWQTWAQYQKEQDAKADFQDLQQNPKMRAARVVAVVEILRWEK